MDIQAWSWGGVLLAATAYWVVLVGGWLVYITRPSTQARARERAFRDAEVNPETGEVMMTFEHQVRRGRIALALFGPPLLLAVIWLIGGAS
jgi:hypothetical protein